MYVGTLVHAVILIMYRVQRVFVLFIDVPKEKLKVSLIVLTSSGLVIKVLSLNSSLSNRSLKGPL